jgi:hypothetical protein
MDAEYMTSEQRANYIRHLNDFLKEKAEHERKAAGKVKHGR